MYIWIKIKITKYLYLLYIYIYMYIYIIYIYTFYIYIYIVHIMRHLNKRWNICEEIGRGRMLSRNSPLWCLAALWRAARRRGSEAFGTRIRGARSAGFEVFRNSFTALSGVHPRTLLGVHIKLKNNYIYIYICIHMNIYIYI